VIPTVLKACPILLCWLMFQGAGALLAADPRVANGNDFENFRVEVTGSAWLVNSGGTIHAGGVATRADVASGTAIDLVTDLGVKQRQPTFYGHLVLKPGRKHRIVIEGTPIRLNGTNTVNRTVVYQGQTFTVGQTLQSSADVNYFFVGYQYDVVSAPAGHLGFSVGGAYLNATGTIHGLQSGLVATKSETIGMPLAGAEGRVFVIPGRKLLEIDGGVRGMAFGGYGHYVEGTITGGIGFGPLTFQAGYRAESADLHSTSILGNGVDVHLRGPIFSIQARW
jgi:acyl-coenzyme A thioesterase PaaI-like protein